MKSITIYINKNSSEFRIVKNDHDGMKDLKNWRVFIYQGDTDLEAAQAAFEVETRSDIKTQIARFVTAEPQKFEITQAVEPVNPEPNFQSPAVIVDTRITNHGWQYAVINGQPNNTSRRWYDAHVLKSFET